MTMEKIFVASVGPIIISGYLSARLAITNAHDAKKSITLNPCVALCHGLFGFRS